MEIGRIMVLKQLPTKEQLEKLYHGEGLTIRQTAKKLGHGHTFINGLFHEYGIELKPKGKYSSLEEKIQFHISRFKNKHVKKLVEEWLKEKSIGIGYTKGHLSRIYTFLRCLDPIKKDPRLVIKNKNKKTIVELLNTKYPDSNVKIGDVRKNRYEMVTFFTWLNGGEKPECVKFVNRDKTLEELKRTRKYPDLTEDEVIKIIDSMSNQRDVTIFTIMGEIPSRSIELRNLNVGDIEKDEYGYLINFGSKTQKGFRKVRLIHGSPQLRLYLQTHKYKNEPDKPLFYNLKNGERLEYWAMEHSLKKAVEKSGVKKNVGLHDFRRFSTTQKMKEGKLSNTELKVLGGWSSLRMLDLYGKVRDVDVNEKLLETSGLKKTKKEIRESKLKPRPCPRCETLNPRNLDSCSKCWLPLSQEKVQEIWKEEKDADLITKETFKKHGKIDREVLKETLRDMIKNGELTL